MSQDNPYAQSFDGDSYQSAGMPRQTSSVAIVSLVCGVLSVPTMCLCFLSIPFSLVAIITGHVARSSIRSAGGAYRGAGEALAGLILGYVTLGLLILSLTFFTLTGTVAPPVAVPAAVPAAVPGGAGQTVSRGGVLLEQAESRLLSTTDDEAAGVTTCEHSATDLAAHFIETLHIVDKTHFAETNSDAEPEPRAYRAFVQLNSDGAAFLLFVPEYARFTAAAQETLSESCWLIAQRSVDDILPQDSQLAVAIYSKQGCQQRMIGTTVRKGPANAGLEQAHAESSELAKLFRLIERPETEAAAKAEEFDSQIDNKALPGELAMPAEAARE